MIIYQCYFWYDDGCTWEKKKEIIVSNKTMTLEEIKTFLYKTKYKRSDDFIDKLQVDVVDSITGPTIL